MDATLKTLWTSFAYFGIVVTIAAMIYGGIAEDNQGLTYTRLISISATVLCTQATLSAAMYRIHASTPELLLFMMCVVFGFIGFVVTLVQSTSSSFNDSEKECIPDTLGLLRKLQILHEVALSTPILWVSLSVRPCPKIPFKTILAAMTMIPMWYSLYFLTIIRRDVNKLAGDSFSDNKWGFGQISAVLAWIPMLVEFGRIWRSPLIDNGKGTIFMFISVRYLANVSEPSLTEAK